MPLEATPVLDDLRSGHVIDEAQHAAARHKMTSIGYDAEPFDQLGNGLVWLLEHGVVSKDQLAALEQDHHDEAGVSINATRQQTLDHLGAALAGKIQVPHQDWERQFWHSLFPGPRWMWFSAGTVLLPLTIWYFLAPPGTPSCADDDTRRTVYSLLRDVHFQMSRNAPAAMYGDTPPPNLMFAKLEDIREIGYIHAERTRACASTIALEGVKVPFFYTIGPGKTTNALVVQGGDERVLMAKFGHANADGKARKTGAPIGEKLLAAAFTTGVVDFEARVHGSKLNPRTGTTEEGKTVQSVLPLGDCEAEQPEQTQARYLCRLQVQYTDRALLVFSRSADAVVEGDFSFVKDGENWKVADNFQQKYLDAMVRGRLEAIAGPAAARRLDEIQRNRDAAATAAK